MTTLDLAVIESRWWQEGNHSVRPVFDTLAATLTDNPYAYHYEMFNSAESLKELVARLVEKHPAIHHLYIAAHGDAQSLGVPGAPSAARS